MAPSLNVYKGSLAKAAGRSTNKYSTGNGRAILVTSLL
jgi:hypothetical protein